MTRMRAAGLALPHEVPKPAVTAMIDAGSDFAARLERAIERSKMIEGSSNQRSSGTNPANGPGTRSAIFEGPK